MTLFSPTIDSVQSTRDIIVDAALTILSEYGLGDFTIRRPTCHLGIVAGAMYWHYLSKQALLDAIADRILAPYTESSATGDWRADVKAIAKLFYSCLTVHRGDAEVISTALATSTATIRPEQPLTDVLGNASETSIGTISAADTASTLVYFILGAAVDQQIAIVLNLNRAEDVSSKGDISTENVADKDIKAETSSEDAVAQVEELDHQRIILGTELFIAGISGAAGSTGIAGH